MEHKKFTKIGDKEIKDEPNLPQLKKETKLRK
jgi:hypothetical protein